MLDQIFFLLHRVLDIYGFTLIIYILMSWFPGARESAFGTFLTSICAPYLEPFRRIIPPLGMIDISPIVAIIVLRIANNSGLPVLYELIARLF